MQNRSDAGAVLSASMRCLKAGQVKSNQSGNMIIKPERKYEISLCRKCRVLMDWPTFRKPEGK